MRSKIFLGVTAAVAVFSESCADPSAPSANTRASNTGGIYDHKCRIMVALTMDSDLGDSWEWADDPRYEERFSALGIRIGVNYVTYAMSH